MSYSNAASVSASVTTPRRLAARHGGFSALLLIAATLLPAGQSLACGMHDYGFSPFPSANARGAPALPAGTRLDVPTLVTAVPATATTVTVDFVTPELFANPTLTVDGPEAVEFAEARERALVASDGSASITFTAAEGFHRLTFTLRGTVAGKTVNLSQQAYLVVRPAEEVAAR